MQDLIKLRHHLHQSPSLSNEEKETSLIIKDFLTQFSPDQIIENIGGHSLAAVYDFDEKGKSIMIRCELDALPIQEKNSISYKSIYKNISHKCGHDGHMAIVCGLAKWLSTKPFSLGQVILLFQAAEETGEGARRVIEDPKFKNLQPDYIFALHNIPGEPLGHILYMPDAFSAEVISCVIHLEGLESHAAEPEKGNNPVYCIPEIIQNLNELNIANVSNEAFRILTPIHIKLGEKAYGLSPGKAELHYTIRSWNTKVMSDLKKNIEELVELGAKKHDLDSSIEWLEYFPSSPNDSKCNAILRKATINANMKIIENTHPFKFGEDFGWFSRYFKSCMFGLGAGINVPPLHNPEYDFPDELIDYGVNIFKAIITESLNSK